MEREEIRVFAPATIANLGVGFNTLGLALCGLGNTVTARRVADKGIKIVSIYDADGNLSMDVGHNPAGIAAAATLRRAGISVGLELEIKKQIPSSAGLGSLTATAVAAAFAVNKLLGSPLRKHELVSPCVEAQRLGKSANANQIAPALLGGLILVHRVKPLDFIRLTLPADLMLAVVTPDLQFDVDKAHEELPKSVPIDDLVQATANIAAFTSACFTSDMTLLAKCINREKLATSSVELVPGSERVIQAALDVGALGSALCGVGSSVFALCRSERSAAEAAGAMVETFKHQDIKATHLLSQAECPGARVDR